MTLEQRLARLEAIEAIQQLKHTYLHSADTKQPELMRSCFAEGDVLIDFGALGVFHHRDQLVDLFIQLGCHDHIVEMHHAQNPRITWLDEFHAEGIWGLYYQVINTQEQTLTILGGIYHDAYQCIDGQWKITKTKNDVVSMQVMQLDSEQGIRSLFAGRQAEMAPHNPAA